MQAARWVRLTYCLQSGGAARCWHDRWPEGRRQQACHLTACCRWHAQYRALPLLSPCTHREQSSVQMQAQLISRYPGLAVVLQVCGTSTGTQPWLLECAALCSAHIATQLEQDKPLARQPTFCCMPGPLRRPRGQGCHHRPGHMRPAHGDDASSVSSSNSLPHPRCGWPSKGQQCCQTGRRRQRRALSLALASSWLMQGRGLT